MMTFFKLAANASIFFSNVFFETVSELIMARVAILCSTLY